jgi:hypothetical protein
MRRTWFLASLLVLGPAPHVLAQAKTPDTAEASKKAAEWVRDNNAFRKDHPLAKDMAKMIEQEVGRVNNLKLTFAPDLMKSGKAHELHLWAGEVFVFPLNNDQARRLALKRGEVRVDRGPNARDLRARTAPVKLGKLTLTGGAALDGARPTTGKLVIEVVAPPQKPVALRLAYTVGGRTTAHYHHLPAGLKKGAQEVSFKFGPINGGGRPPHAGPVVVFVEACEVANKGGGVEVTILSNTLAQLVDVTGGAGLAKPGPGPAAGPVAPGPRRPLPEALGRREAGGM